MNRKFWTIIGASALALSMLGCGGSDAEPVEVDGEVIGETPVTVREKVDKISFLEIVRRLLEAFSFS